MRRLQNTESVWWYVTREFQEALGRPIDDEEVVCVTLVVSALTKLLADSAAAPELSMHQDESGGARSREPALRQADGRSA